MKYTNKNYIIFDDDDDFFNYAINPEPVIKALDDNVGYFTFETTDKFNSDIDSNIKFLMRDKNSLIMKHGCVSYRTISIPVKIELLDSAISNGYITENDII